jgi:hypothetical protein
VTGICLGQQAGFRRGRTCASKTTYTDKRNVIKNFTFSLLITLKYFTVLKEIKCDKLGRMNGTPQYLLEVIKDTHGHSKICYKTREGKPYT